MGGTLYWHGKAVNLLSPSLAPSMPPAVEPFHKTCRDLLDSNPATPSGVYTLDSGLDGTTYTVYCDMDTQGGG